MLETSIAESVISQGLEQGANFVDLFVEQQRTKDLNWVNRGIKDVKSGTDFGIGIRAVYGTQVVYGYSNSIQKDDLLNLIKQLGSGAKTAQHSPLVPTKIKNRNPATHGLNKQIDLKQQKELLSKIDEQTRSHDNITQAELITSQRWQQVQIFNSEGLNVSDDRHYTILRTKAIASDGSKQAAGRKSYGYLKGWEAIQELDIQQVADHIAKQARVILQAEPCPAGSMPVIIDNAFGGVIFHEACGHLLETTAVAKQASVFHDKIGQMIANPVVSAVDDGTLPGHWGSLNIDDEGCPTQRTQLIKNGKLTSFLVDKIGSLKTGYEPTGSGRRESYHFAPASRMRNTFIEPGTDSMDDMLASVDYGIFAKSMGGGSVMPGTGEFNFAVEEAWLIEKGKLVKPVKGATLIGTGPDILNKISMVSDNFELAPGMCGSVSGSIPTTVGQAALKVDEILVGGQV